MKKEQKGKNPLELGIRFLKYYYTCYEHSVAAVLSMFGSKEFESNASLKRNPSPKRFAWIEVFICNTLENTRETFAIIYRLVIFAI